MIHRKSTSFYEIKQISVLLELSNLLGYFLVGLIVMRSCLQFYIRNISYCKNTLIILPFGLFLLNLQCMAIVMQKKQINWLKIMLVEQVKLVNG